MEGPELTSKFEGRTPMVNIEYFDNKMKTEPVQFEGDAATGTSNVAIVTGASSGIGLEVTKRLVAKGYRVVANSRNITPGEPMLSIRLEFRFQHAFKAVALKRYQLLLCKSTIR
jgi:hypothetical protein